MYRALLKMIYERYRLAKAAYSGDFRFSRVCFNMSECEYIIVCQSHLTGTPPSRALL